MLALNRVAALRRLKPKKWLFVVVVSLVFSLGSLAAFDANSLLFWGCLILFGGGGACFWFFGIASRGKAYQPLASFRELRGTDAEIIHSYNGIRIIGIVSCLGYLGYGLLGGSKFDAIDGAVTGIFTLLAASYGLQAKKVHRGVDPSAVKIAAGFDPSQQGQARLAYANFEARDAAEKKGNAVLIVMDDSLVLGRHDGDRWQAVSHSFNDVAELGFYREETSIEAYFLFGDRSEFAIELNPTNVGTSEPITFCRSLLHLFDAYLLFGPHPGLSLAREPQAFDAGFVHSVIAKARRQKHIGTVRPAA
jgi:hypothetical protein